MVTPLHKAIFVWAGLSQSDALLYSCAALHPRISQRAASTLDHATDDNNRDDDGDDEAVLDSPGGGRELSQLH